MKTIFVTPNLGALVLIKHLLKQTSSRFLSPERAEAETCPLKIGVIYFDALPEIPCS